VQDAAPVRMARPKHSSLRKNLNDGSICDGRTSLPTHTKITKTTTDDGSNYDARTKRPGI